VNSSGIEVMLLPSTTNQTICILDISCLVTSTDSDSLWFLVNLLSLSSALLVEKSSHDETAATATTLLQFQFLEQVLFLFQNEMGNMKSAVTFPPLLFYSLTPISTKDSKKFLEIFFKPESGFTEEISRKNALRAIVDSLFHSREIMTPETSEGPQDPRHLFTTGNFQKRFDLSL
jgi:hypothetical protein